MMSALSFAKNQLSLSNSRSRLSFFALLLIMPISYFSNQYALTVFLIGGILGATLNYFQFGFRTCSQQLLSQTKTLGIRAVLIMLVVSSLLFFPLLSIGQIGQQTMTGFVQPLSLSVVVGAFIFGLGMQLSNGCTSGTLNKLGQLQPLSFTSFLSLLAGGVLAAYHADFWQTVPALPAFSILQNYGFFWGLTLQLAIIGALYAFVHTKEKRHFGQVSPLFSASPYKITAWHPWLKAGIFLALMNFLLLMVTGKPWSIANVFPLWGIQLSDTLHLPLDWSFWSYGITHFSRLESPIWTDTVSLSTLGLIFGALLVTLAQGKSTDSASDSIHYKDHLYAMLGGIIMGYGAVIAFGCNIGAFFSGISSGSLHGWLWAVSALAGNALGIRLRSRLP